MLSLKAVIRIFNLFLKQNVKAFLGYNDDVALSQAKLPKNIRKLKYSSSKININFFPEEQKGSSKEIGFFSIFC